MPGDRFMRKYITILLFAAIATTGFLAVQWFRSQPGELLNNTRFNWYESKTYSEIENGNKFAQERLSKKYHIFVNGIFVDIGYDWDGVIYVPIRSISQCLNWSADWLPELSVIHLVKGGQEAFADIVNFFGKGYMPLDRLENLLHLEQVQVHGGNIEIQTQNGRLQSISLRNLDRFSFYINDMKMTDNAAAYQGQKYVPSRIFALSFGRSFRYDAVGGSSYIDNREIDTIFINGEAYSSLENLEGVVDTSGACFSFRAFAIDNKKPLPVIDKGPKERVVALTFDDYLGDKVYPLLDVLDRYDVKATFFIIGNSIESNADVLKELAERGHRAANHTWDHYNSHTLTEDEVRAQLISTQLCIEKYGGQSTPFFRPPGGYYNGNIINIAQDAGLRTVLWSVNSNDAAPQTNAEDIQKAVTRWVHPGAIVVMHTNKDVTIEALPGIIEQLRSRGYRFVTISEIANNAGS